MEPLLQRLRGAATRRRERIAQRSPTRRTRVEIDDRLFELRGRLDLQFVRPLAAQQLVEHHAERVHVARGRERFAQQLLGAGVLRCERPAGDARELGLVARAAFGFHQLGDAEVEQTHFALRGDEDVAGLQVAVDHEVGVRVLHRQQHLAEKAHAAFDVQCGLVAPDRERLAFDVFERQPRLPRRRDAGVVQTGDVRVVERGEDVALAGEALREAVALRAARGAEQQLDRDLAAKRAVVALRQPHFGHAALPHVADQPVRADAAARRPLVHQRLGLDRQRRQRRQKAVATHFGAGGQHLLQLAEQGVRLGLQAGEPAVERRAIERVGRFVQRREFLPVCYRVPLHGLVSVSQFVRGEHRGRAGRPQSGKLGT